MSELGDRFAEEMEQLRAVRDELRVQAHLGKMEAQEIWETAEKNWQDLEGRVQRLRRDAEAPLHEVGEAARQLAREIGDAYRELRKLI